MGSLLSTASFAWIRTNVLYVARLVSPDAISVQICAFRTWDMPILLQTGTNAYVNESVVKVSSGGQCTLANFTASSPYKEDL